MNIPGLHMSLERGSNVIEPMCYSNGTRLPDYQSEWIDRARTEALLSHYQMKELVNPYAEDSPAFRVYGSTARAELEDDVNPYGVPEK